MVITKVSAWFFDIIIKELGTGFARILSKSSLFVGIKFNHTTDYAIYFSWTLFCCSIKNGSINNGDSLATAINLQGLGVLIVTCDDAATGFFLTIFFLTTLTTGSWAGSASDSDEMDDDDDEDVEELDDDG